MVGKPPTQANQIGNCGFGSGIPIITANFFPVGQDDPAPVYLPPRDPTDPTQRVEYARAGSPTVWALEEVLATLEGGEVAVCAASGMSAISQCLLAHLSAGDRLIYSKWAYSNTVDFLANHLGRLGIQAIASDTNDLAALEADLAQHRPKILFFEPLSNPALAYCPAREIAAFCKAYGVISVADNSLLSPAILRPLDHGVDIVIHSLTKIIGGFGEAMGGVVIGRRELINPVARMRWSLGGVLAPQVAGKILDGVRSLDLRVRKTSSSALQVATKLATDARIAELIYPGLASYHWRDPFAADCGHLGGSVITFFHKGGAEAVARMANSSSFIRFGPSFGMAITSCNGGTASERYYDQPAGFVRLSIGLEDPEDIITELDRIL